MSDISVMRADDLMRRLRRLANNRGWKIAEREGRGSHVVLTLNGRRTVVPMHRGDMPPGTYLGVLKQLGLKPEDVEI